MGSCIIISRAELLEQLDHADKGGISMVEKKIQEIKNQIAQWAKENNNVISSMAFIDILKEECDHIDEKYLNQIMYELSAEGIEVETSERDETYSADGDAPEKFIPADVTIGQMPMNIYNLMERLDYGELDLQPDFQRRGGLWTDVKQSRLIESLMLKIPLPAFYFDASREDKWVVIDGLQRLTAFQNYLVGEEKDGRKIQRKFQDLQYLAEFNGLTFDELPRQYARRIKEASVIAYIVEKGTPEEVVFNIFQRINTGGLQLSDQEIRHALYQGKGTELTVKLACSDEFLNATQYAIKPDRMLDREYVTRYIAFTELDYKKEYKGNIDNFLIKGLKQVNNYDEPELERIDKSFKRVMRYVNLIFEKYAFRKYNENWRRGPMNKAIFELWSVCFSSMADSDLDRIVERKQEFLERFKNLLQNNEFSSAIKAGDVYSCVKRINLAQKMIEEFLW